LSTAKSKKTAQPEQTLFGHALSLVLKELCETLKAKSNRDLIEKLLNPNLPGDKQIAYQHVNMMISGVRKEPRPGTILDLVRRIGNAARWSEDRISEESIKLLLAADYHGLPGLLPRHVDAAYTKLRALLDAIANGLSDVEEENRLNIGIIVYPPFVREGGKEGFAIDVARLLFSSLLQGRDLGYVTWDTAVDFAHMIEKLQSHEVDLVVSGVYRTIPRNVRASFVELPALRMYVDAITRPGFKDPASWSRGSVRVVCREGEIGHEYAQSCVPGATLVVKAPTTGTDKVLESVLGKNPEADVALADEATCAIFENKHRGEVCRVKRLYGYRAGFVTRREDAEWVKVLRESLELLCTGLEPLLGIYRKWSDEIKDFRVKEVAEAVGDPERVFVSNLLK